MRPQVSRLTPSYSYRAAVETGAFGQFRLLRADEFGRECKARDIAMSFGSALHERLEALDREGALCPVLFELGERCGISDGVVPSCPVFRDETDFTEWNRLPGPAPDPAEPEPRARPLYSRWQLLYAWDALDLGAIRVSLDALLAPEGFTPAGAVDAWLRRQQEDWRSLDAQWRGAVLLLIRLQGRFAPRIKGRLGHVTSTMVWYPERRDMVDPWEAERRSFDASAVLDELGLTLGEIKDLHRQLAFRALSEDPLERWHPLSRMAPFQQRQKLKGAALRAQDGYDAADMLRWFYYQLTSELLPEADELVDLSDGGWRRRLYGDDWPTLRLGHNHLAAQLRRLRLWPLQVHLVLEGESEEIAARHIFGAVLGEIVLASAGITITNIQGVGNLRRQQAVFSLAKSAASWTLLICDREGDAVKDVGLLQQDGLIDPETTLIWEKSFEEDNFTDEELVEELQAIGRDRGAPLALDAVDSRAAYRDRQRRIAGKPGGFADFLIKRAGDPAIGPLTVKKRDLAARLAQRMLGDLEQLGQDKACEKRPFLAQMLAVLRVT